MHIRLFSFEIKINNIIISNIDDYDDDNNNISIIIELIFILHSSIKTAQYHNIISCTKHRNEPTTHFL